MKILMVLYIPENATFVECFLDWRTYLGILYTDALVFVPYVEDLQINAHNFFFLLTIACIYTISKMAKAYAVLRRWSLPKATRLVINAYTIHNRSTRSFCFLSSFKFLRGWKWEEMYHNVQMLTCGQRGYKPG